VPVVPTPPTIAPGILTSSKLNQIRDVERFYGNPPVAQMRQTVAQSLPNNTWTALTFNVEDVDTDIDGAGGHSTSVNTSRFTAQYPGWYLLGGAVGFDTNGTGVRAVRWAVVGIALNAGGPILPTASGAVTVVPAPAELVYMTTGDLVELQALQSSGAALNTSVVATAQPTMTVTWKSN
jgi:hypothetical protein